VWLWIAIGVCLLLVFSLLVGMALARVLGTIGREISELYETEDWAKAPPTRALKDANEGEPQEAERKRGRLSRLR